MRATRALAALIASVVIGYGTGVSAQEPPAIPTGLDVYTQWEKWPYLRIGQQTFMRSTYGRKGGNEGADDSRMLYQLADNRKVTLDLEGTGVLAFAHINHGQGNPWHYVVDDMDLAESESGNTYLSYPKARGTFLSGVQFPEPFGWSRSTTRAADMIEVPIPFTRTLRMGYEGSHNSPSCYIFNRYVPGTKLTQPLHAWEGQLPPPKVVRSLVSRSGMANAPSPDTPEACAAGLQELQGYLDLHAGGIATIANLKGTPRMLRLLAFTIPSHAIDFGKVVLRVTWDDRKLPSIEAPLALFFGAGTLYNRDGGAMVQAFPVSADSNNESAFLSCIFPMPFFHSAKIELIAPEGPDLDGIQWHIRYEPLRVPTEQVGYFHATYQDFPHAEAGKDLVLLDTNEVEGGGDWSGHLVGTSIIFSHNANMNSLKGEPLFFFDDSRSPQVQGRGIEEWDGGGDCWGGKNTTLPFFGRPTGARSAKEAMTEEDKIESAYRFLLADLMPFGRNAKLGIELVGTEEASEHYETLAYWYGAPCATLVPTDTLRIGNVESERTHDYLSPQASQPFEINSRYEWDVALLGAKLVSPTEKDRGRTTKGTTEFVLKLNPRNVGVSLRRKLDYSYPNQRAEVFLADVPEDRGKALEWHKAGIWYLAGSCTCVYANPHEESGTKQPAVQTSNRKFRDDDFLLPRDLTRGRKRIRVRIQFTPVSISLSPGNPLPELAWSEIRYTAYCYLYPDP